MCRQATAEWADVSGLADDEEPVEGYGCRATNEAHRLAFLVANPALADEVAAGLLAHRSPTVADAALTRLGHDPDVVPARALVLRHRRGLLFGLLAQAGAPVQDPEVRDDVLQRLPSAAGSVSDLAATVRHRN